MSKPLPLAGVRVLDLSRVLAGPLCGQVLGDFGAEVIKIEHPKRGDDTRDWGIRVGKTQTAYFNSFNRNKRSVTVDLQTPQGQELVLELAGQCDVVLQNFKYGGVEKMGLGYEQIRALKPDIIYCSVSGYDRHGSEAERPGYDVVVQGESGLMSINGEATQQPLKFGVPLVDMFTGMYAAQAVLAALFERERTGRGRHVEMALFDSGIMISSHHGLEALLLQKDPPRHGNVHPLIMPYGVFEAQDGPLIIAVGNNAQFERFCTEVIERPDLAADERFKTNPLRGQNKSVLLPELHKELGARPREQLLKRLGAVGIPCGEVLGLHEALTSPRTGEAGLLSRHPHAHAGEVDVMVPPYRLDGQRLPVRHAPPELGEDTEQVLAQVLGAGPDRLAALKKLSII